MPENICRLVFTAIVVLISRCSYAAPLDDFLQAHTTYSHKGAITLSYDFIDESIDILDLKSDFKVPVDYEGYHLNAGYAVGPVWFDASLWQRSLSVGTFSVDLQTWQLAGRYSLYNGGKTGAHLAIRAGIWGNYSDRVERRQNFLADIKQSTIQVENPNDRQLQLDLIGSLPVTTNTVINAHIGAGSSQVDFDDVSASGSFQGCFYDLTLAQTEYIGTLAAPCDADAVITRFSSPYSKDDANVHTEMRYDSLYYQLGLSAVWQSENWLLAGAYRYLYVDRDNVDEALKSRDKETYTSNHIVSTEVAYRLWNGFYFSVRAQYFNNLLTGELPLAYNSITARYFERRFIMLSTGIRFIF